MSIAQLSPAKQLIFDNQECGNAVRYFAVFASAFWRGEYNGYAAFGPEFPFNEMVDLSPQNLCCGVLAFVFIREKYERWLAAYPTPAQQQQYIRDIVAEMYLKGDR